MEKIVSLFGEKIKGKNGDVNTGDLCGENKLIGKSVSMISWL